MRSCARLADASTLLRSACRRSLRHVALRRALPTHGLVLNASNSTGLIKHGVVLTCVGVERPLVGEGLVLT